MANITPQQMLALNDLNNVEDIQVFLVLDKLKEATDHYKKALGSEPGDKVSFAEDFQTGVEQAKTGPYSEYLNDKGIVMYVAALDMQDMAKFLAAAASIAAITGMGDDMFDKAAAKSAIDALYELKSLLPKSSFVNQGE